MSVETQLMAITPIDGRYANAVADLAPIVSEFGLIQRRVAVGIGWVGVLGSGLLPDVEPLSDRAREALDDIPQNFSLADAVEIKTIEKETQHDANAVVRWLKERLKTEKDFRDYVEFVHFGGTSEDTNNLAYAMMIRDVKQQVLTPRVTDITETLDDISYTYADLPQLARTHGQAASPTTVGKELAVFVERLRQYQQALGAVTILGKFNGATGNYSAVSFAYPEVDWPAASRQLVDKLGFAYNAVTTQIDSHDWMARFFNEVAVGNNILLDLSRDMWLYIMLGEFAQQVVPGEDGSSAMPNKVNPIHFENAEANLGLANAIFNHLANKLPVSRLQRDLSDSSALRSVGEAFGHTLVAHNSLKRAWGIVHPDEVQLAAHLDAEWAVLMEPLKTVMSRYGIEDSYDIIKKASRGKPIDQIEYLKLVQSLHIPDEPKERLLALTPATYTGRAADIVRRKV